MGDKELRREVAAGMASAGDARYIAGGQFVTHHFLGKSPMAIQLETPGVVPGITVNDLEKSIRFYTDGLGCTVASRNEVDGVLRWVMLKVGQGEMALGQDDFAKGKDRAKGVATRFYIRTKQDLQALAAQIVAAGFALDQGVRAMPWGPLAFEVTDPDGFKLTISNQ